MISLIEGIDTAPLLEEYARLEAGIQWTDFGHKGKQTGLQYRLDEDPWASAVGTMKGFELAYFKLNPFFKDTLIAEVIKKYNMRRARLMWVGPYACYSMHRDTTKRVHVPLITNPNCYFVHKDAKPFFLEPGKVWMVDTTADHTFMNCSSEPRLHLVGVSL